MGLGSACVDRARPVRRAAAGLRVEGRTQYGETKGPWFHCRLELPAAGEQAGGVTGMRPVITEPTLMYVPRDEEGDELHLTNQDRLEVVSRELGSEDWELTGDPQPIRKKRTLIGWQAALKRVAIHEADTPAIVPPPPPPSDHVASSSALALSDQVTTDLTAGLTALPEFPIISRGLPYSSSQGAQFGGPNDEANAIDADYGTTWDSVFTPNDGSAEWYVLDMRGVAAAVKSDLWFVWKNWHGNYYEPTATLGPDGASAFTALPRNYKVQGHASSGPRPAVGDAGWVDFVTVTDNRWNQRIHSGINLSAYNWFRFYCSSSSGVGGISESVQLQFDLRDARISSADSIFFYGDSITHEVFNAREPGNTAWGPPGPLENALQTLTSRPAPVVIDAGVGGWTAIDGDTNKALYIGGTPCEYIALCFGSNDANLANIDLNDPGVIPNGINSTYAQNFKARMQSMIDYSVGLGKKVIIPRIIFGSLTSWTGPNLLILNTLIDQLVAANPGNVLLGPDPYSLFAAHPNLLRDQLHPTYDDSVSGGKFNGMTGYENLISLWRDRLEELLY